MVINNLCFLMLNLVGCLAVAFCDEKESSVAP